MSATYDDEAAAGVALAALYQSQVVPVGVEVDRPEPGGLIDVAVALEGVDAGMDHRVEQVLALLGGRATVTTSAPPWWAALPGEVVIKITAEISAVPRVLRDLAALAPGTRPGVRASAALGIVYVGLPGSTDPEAVAPLLATARAVAQRPGGAPSCCAGRPRPRPRSTCGGRCLRSP